MKLKIKHCILTFKLGLDWENKIELKTNWVKNWKLIIEIANLKLKLKLKLKMKVKLKLKLKLELELELKVKLKLKVKVTLKLKLELKLKLKLKLILKLKLEWHEIGMCVWGVIPILHFFKVRWGLGPGLLQQGWFQILEIDTFPKISLQRFEGLNFCNLQNEIMELLQIYIHELKRTLYRERARPVLHFVLQFLVVHWQCQDFARLCFWGLGILLWPRWKLGGRGRGRGRGAGG